MTPLVPLPVAAAWKVADHGVGDAARHDLVIMVAAGVDAVIFAASVVVPLASGSVVVTAVGQIDARTAPALSCCPHQAIENRSVEVVLDLTAVTAFDDAGLRILVCAADHARACTVSFAIVCNEPAPGILALRPL